MSGIEYHVASYVVLTRPENASRIASQITQVPGLEVHANEQGKLIVTAEAESTGQLADLAGALELMDAVLQVAPCYHEFTREPDTKTEEAFSADTNNISRSQSQ